MLLTKKPYPVPGYQVELLDNEILLFNPSSRIIFRSNSTGALIWQLCDGKRSVADIIQLLQANYPEAHAQIQKDVQDTLQAFATHNAIIWM